MRGAAVFQHVKVPQVLGYAGRGAVFLHQEMERGAVNRPLLLGQDDRARIDLTECLAIFERFVKKYKILLTGAGLTTLLPTFQYDWKAIFYFPWLSSPETLDTPEE